MKNNRKWFITVEAVLAAMVMIPALLMVWEKRREDNCKVSVIVENSDDNQWAAFKYGLKMAAEDQGIELFVVSTGGMLTAEEEMNILNQEIEHGADAVIVQPVLEPGIEEMLKNAEKKVPVMLVECTVSDGQNESRLPAVVPDHYGMGRTLAEELLKDYNGNIDGKTIGIVMQTADSESSVKRQKGLEDGLKNTGAYIKWRVTGDLRENERKSFKNQPETDFVIALDDSSLTAAGEYASANNLHGALVYGIGNSTEAAYYLDTGNVECLTVPDGFSMGYQSLTEIAGNMGYFYRKMKDRTVSHTVIRREELFSKKNQEILFTMSQ